MQLNIYPMTSNPSKQIYIENYMKINRHRWISNAYPMLINVKHTLCVEHAMHNNLILKIITKGYDYVRKSSKSWKCSSMTGKRTAARATACSRQKTASTLGGQRGLLNMQCEWIKNDENICMALSRQPKLIPRRSEETEDYHEIERLHKSLNHLENTTTLFNLELHRWCFCMLYNNALQNSLVSERCLFLRVLIWKINYSKTNCVDTTPGKVV